jgi:hypothetical protein
VTTAQQRFDSCNLTAAPRHLTFGIRSYDFYRGGFVTGCCGFGGHLWPVFARHPTW